MVLIADAAMKLSHRTVLRHETNLYRRTIFVGSIVINDCAVVEIDGRVSNALHSPSFRFIMHENGVMPNYGG